MSGWGAPVRKDNGEAVKEHIVGANAKAKDVNPTLLVDQRMGANAEQIREFDHTGQVVKKEDNTRISDLVLQKDGNVERTTFAQQPDHTPDTASAPSRNWDELNPNYADNPQKNSQVHDVQLGETMENYSYHVKEVVLATGDNPPGPESGWKMGKIDEILIQGTYRVKFRDGTRVEVDPAKNQLRPMTQAEIKTYKQEHKGEADIPCWMMVVLSPCMLLIAPCYFFGCLENAGLVDCCDVCGDCGESCIECCEDAGEACESCLECFTCGLC